MSKITRVKRPWNWRMAVCSLPGFRSNIVTRQQVRATKRKKAFEQLSEQFGGELRKVRRAMALTLAKRPGFNG